MIDHSVELKKDPEAESEESNLAKPLKVQKVLNPSINLKDQDKFTFVMKRVLKSMKLGEKSFTVVQKPWFEKHDKEGIEKYDIKDNERLKIDLTFKEMIHIEDFYKDGTVYRKVLRKGETTASPLSDSLVAIRLKVSYSKLSEDEEEIVLALSDEPLVYALDEYMIPKLLRNIMKTLKVKEQIEIHTMLKDELIPEFEDEKYGMFKAEWYDKIGEVDEKTGRQRWIIIGLEMVDFDTPEAMHGLYLVEKMPRMLRIKEIAAKFFKIQNWSLANKMYHRLYNHFNLKDIYNNLKEEDVNTEEFKTMTDDLKKLELQTITNLLVVKSKLKEWNDVVEFSVKALVIEPKNIKALFFRGKAYLNLLEYDEAIKVFNQILTLEKDNADVIKELAKAKLEKKKYNEKQKQMFKQI